MPMRVKIEGFASIMVKKSGGYFTPRTPGSGGPASSSATVI